MTTAKPAGCTVYFDGACPLCRREIALYRRQAGAASIAWVDAADCGAHEFGAGLDRDAALARLHVRRADGSLVSGAAAFIAIWARLPAYGWLAAVASRGPVRRMLEAAYSGFLRLRRLWRRSASRDALPPAALAMLRADHAFEVGALQFCRGQLATARDGNLRARAARGLAVGHLRLQRLRRELPVQSRSRLLPLWRAIGWLAGATVPLLGARAARALAAPLERHIDARYAERIDHLAVHPRLDALRATLAACRPTNDRSRRAVTMPAKLPPSPKASADERPAAIDFPSPPLAASAMVVRRTAIVEALR